MDSLSEFLAGLTWADVEPERLAPLSRARLESFGGRDHRAMLVTHDMQRARFAAEGHGLRRLPPEEPVRVYKPKPKRKKPVKPVQQFTSSQIEAALRAMNNRKAG